MDDLPRSLSAARTIGSRYYYTGKPCTRQHIDKRNLQGRCMECQRENASEKREEIRGDAERLARRRTYERDRMRRVLSDPTRRTHIRGLERTASRKPERVRRKAGCDAQRNCRVEVKERRRDLQRDRYHRLKDDPAFQDQARRHRQRWYRRHPAKAIARCNVRRALRLQATPPWLTESMKLHCVEFYQEARERSQATGVRHEVDHIVPLQGDTVCGLHVPWNLRVITRRANRAKANRLPDDPSDHIALQM